MTINPLKFYKWAALCAAAFLAFNLSASAQTSGDSVISLLPGISIDTTGILDTPAGLLSIINNQIVPQLNNVYGLHFRTITLSEATTIYNLAQAGDFTGLENELIKIWGSGVNTSNPSASFVASPSSAGGENVSRIFHQVIINKAKTKDEAQADAAKAEQPMKLNMGGDLSYNYTQIKGGGGIHTYGADIGGTIGDKFEVRADIPIYRTHFTGTDFNTYGVNLSAKAKITDGFSAGVAASYQHSDGSAPFDANTYTVGPFAGYTAKLNDMLSLSGGILMDHISQDHQKTTWLGAVGLNLGVNLGDNMTLNPYYIYYHNMTDWDVTGSQWHELGLEVRTVLAKTWAVSAGIQTQVGYAFSDYGIQVYLGSTWNF